MGVVPASAHADWRTHDVAINILIIHWNDDEWLKAEANLKKGSRILIENL